MSLQAMTWAIEQEVGSPSARCILMSIGNYANAQWCAWPYQETIARDAVQSVDSVQRRMPELIAAGLVRRIKLKRFGRRTHDFYILPRSPFFESTIEEIRPLLPASCDVIEDAAYAAADCGSDKTDTALAPSDEPENDAAADCGSVEGSTLPQSALHATALVRQQEPFIKESKIPTPTPSKLEGALKNQPQLSEAAEQRFREFKAAYPDGIVDLDKAQREFAGLADADQAACVTAAPVYAARCRKRREKSKKAHLFIRERAWIGLLAATDPKSATPTQHPPTSPAGRALLTLARIARYTPLMLNGNVVFTGEVPTQILALANAPPEDQWIRDARGSRNFAAWRDLGNSIWPGRGFQYDWIDAPWPWPPRKDGSIIPTGTGPPGTLSDDEDVEALSGT